MGPLQHRLVEGYSKSQARKRGEKTGSGGAKIPGNWTSFLRVDENKTELFSFLFGVLHDSFQLADKELVITEGDDVVSKPPLLDTTALSPCNHEEADIRMLHAAHAALVRTLEEKVIVLYVSVSPETGDSVPHKVECVKAVCSSSDALMILHGRVVSIEPTVIV